MTDPQPNPRKSLSEISHLFLSDLRDSVSGGVRPTRLPPGAPRPPQADRHAHEPNQPSPAEPAGAAKQVLALVCAHLNGSQGERARQYARHLAAGGPRVGLIEMSGAELRLSCFDRNAPDADNLSLATDCLESCDDRHAADALAELAWDIDQWVLLVTDTRTAEARQLLAAVPHWVLLSTTDHDGVVSCYRSIKGLAGKPRGDRPRLSLALLNAASADEARRVHRKIAGVCQQFLDWQLESAPAVPPAQELLAIESHPVLLCRPGAGSPTGVLWRVLSDFLTHTSAEPAEDLSQFTPRSAATSSLDARELTDSNESNPLDDTVMPAASASAPALDAGQPLRISPVVPPIKPSPAPSAAGSPAVSKSVPNSANPSPRTESTSFPTAAEPAGAQESEVTELPPGPDADAAVLAAVLSQTSLGLIASPIRPPSAPQAVLAVGRDHRLVVLAVARQGLSELQALGQAYRWTIENRPLLSMALPQFSIDTHAMPEMRLLVDRRDLSAEQLQPLLQAGNVTVHTYRKLRWGAKTGLLLEAA
jgi:hypothetical protein